MKFRLRWSMVLFTLAVFGSGMLASVGLSWVRMRWACRGLSLSIPADYRKVMGQSKVLGAIEDFVAVKMSGGVLAEGEEDLFLIQRNGQWIAHVSRDAQDGHLKALSFDAYRTGSYTVFYDKGPTPRELAFAGTAGPGESTLYIDGNVDGVCEWIRGPKTGLHLYTASGWLPARHVRPDYWIQMPDARWYRAEELPDKTYRPIGDPQAQPPASQPERQAGLPEE